MILKHYSWTDILNLRIAGLIDHFSKVFGKTQSWQHNKLVTFYCFLYFLVFSPFSFPQIKSSNDRTQFTVMQVILARLFWSRSYQDMLQ